MVDKSNKPAALAGIAAIAIFIPSIFLTANYSHSFQNWYTTNEYFDWDTMAISHFGVSSLAIPFTAIVTLVSLLIIYFMVSGVKRSYGEDGLLKRGVSWVVTGFASLILAFVFLLYEPNSAFSIATHFLVAIVYFVSIPVGMMMIGISFIKRKRSQLGFTSLALGIFAFVFGPVICIGSSLLFGDKGVAIPELAQIVTEDIWIVIIGIDILKQD
jgi:hypothetical membrane protein